MRIKQVNKLVLKRLGQKSQKYENRMKFVFKNVDFIRFLYFNSVQNLANLDFCPSLFSLKIVLNTIAIPNRVFNNHVIDFGQAFEITATGVRNRAL